MQNLNNYKLDSEYLEEFDDELGDMEDPTNEALFQSTHYFRNRRIKSDYLRKCYPSGFQVAKLRTDMLGSSEDFLVSAYGQADQSLAREADLQPVKPVSFMSWAKGGNAFEDLMEYNDESEDFDDDPYADVAGPFYQDLMKNRPAVVNKQGSISSTDIAVVSKEVFFSQRAAQNRVFLQLYSLMY